MIHNRTYTHRANFMSSLLGPAPTKPWTKHFSQLSDITPRCENMYILWSQVLVHKQTQSLTLHNYNPSWIKSRQYDQKLHALCTVNMKQQPICSQDYWILQVCTPETHNGQTTRISTSHPQSWDNHEYIFLNGTMMHTGLTRFILNNFFLPGSVNASQLCVNADIVA